MRHLYSLLWTFALPLVCVRLWWRGRQERGYWQHWGERFGFYAPTEIGKFIWIHAVSVGETRAAQPLLTALLQRYPESRILLTHMTPTGRATGRALFAEHGARVLQSYLPYDLVWLVQRFLRHFSPQICILMETEVWPNMLFACERAGVPVALVNARLSARSWRKAQRFGGLMRAAAARISVVAAQTQEDANRIQSLGAPMVEVTGSIKFDVAIPEPALVLGRSLREYIGTRPVLLCASTREGEEALLLTALAGYLQSGQGTPLLLLVPRHPQRFDEVAQLVAAHGLSHQRRSGLSVAQLASEHLSAEVSVLLGDSMGEMFAYYSACDLAFIGGSLLPLGGQNLIEACALGKPVLIGPHTFNFAQVCEQAIAAGGAMRIADAQALLASTKCLLHEPQRCQQMGEQGRAFTLQHRGATEKTLGLLGRYLG
jgi:3-deoxy-D-manno-octulosonic-acid transferase